MKLYELHVGEPAAGLQSQIHPAPSVLVAPGRAHPPQARVPAGREHHGVGQVHGPLAAVHIERVRPETTPVVDEELADVLPLLYGDAQGLHLIYEREEHRPAGIVAGVAGTAILVCPEEALVELPGRRPRERGAPLGELVDGAGSLFGHDLNDPGVGEVVALLECVREVLLPGVLRVAGTKGRVDAASGEHRVGVLAGTRPNYHGLRTRFV